ncbi:MAG: hypothetical protein LAQ30_32815, partial [Acidobacteriia bacterium]|nr:hypothetical protein [Terriglobia bacterium]
MRPLRVLRAPLLTLLLLAAASARAQTPSDCVRIYRQRYAARMTPLVCEAVKFRTEPGNTDAVIQQGLAALGRGKPAEGVERLQDALRYELALNGLNAFPLNLGGLYSAYVRGEAF